MQQEQQTYGPNLLQELEQLRTENARLKEILQANGIAYEVVTADAVEKKVHSDISFPDAHLGKDERVELFRNFLTSSMRHPN